MGFQEKVASAIAIVVIPFAFYYALQARDFIAAHRTVMGKPEEVQSAFAFLLDFAPAVGFAVFIVAVRVIVGKLMLRRLAEKLVVKQPDWDESQLSQRREKFQHCMYLVIYYVPATLFGWYALYDKEWVPGVVVPGASGDTRNCWRDLWNQNNDYTSVKMYYMFSLGYALQSLVFLIIRKHRRDFIEMAFHHALEVFLIVYSWAYGYVRIGTLVLALHDVGDVFVNVMRCTNEVRLVKTSIFLLISTIITWIWYRLWVFPGWVIHSTMFEAYGILINQDNTLHSEGYYFFNFMLCGLLALHWFWFYMFLKIAYHALFLSKVDDEVDVVVSEAEGHHHKHH